MRVRRVSSIDNWRRDSSDIICNTHVWGQPPLLLRCTSGRVTGSLSVDDIRCFLRVPGRRGGNAACTQPLKLRRIASGRVRAARGRHAPDSYRP
jgi:hypothetical protein